MEHLGCQMQKTVGHARGFILSSALLRLVSGDRKNGFELPYGENKRMADERGV